MADLYKIVYPTKSTPIFATALVSATSVANAIAAVKAADASHKIDTQHVGVTVLHPGILTGS
jgi:hypothetical protein